MILGLFRKKTPTEPVFAVYRTIVAQSRQPRFYADWGVPDTVTGRFDMISLHLSLLFRRLRRGGADAQVFSQAVFDLFFKDMDNALREQGVSDLGVPKKVQKMGGVFYGLLTSVNEAIDAGGRDALIEVLARNVLDGDATHAGALADYLIAEAAHLDAQPVGSITAGAVTLGAAA